MIMRMDDAFLSQVREDQQMQHERAMDKAKGGRS